MKRTTYVLYVSVKYAKHIVLFFLMYLFMRKQGLLPPMRHWDALIIVYFHRVPAESVKKKSSTSSPELVCTGHEYKRLVDNKKEFSA